MNARNFLTKLITLIVVSFIVVGSSMAFDATNRVTVAKGDQGDFLMGPFYSVDGFETHVEVINTSSYAIIAKVVFRSPFISGEALDFMLYLTPYDKWDAVVTLSDTLDTSGNRVAKIRSTDDSCLAKKDVFASEAVPFETDFYWDKLGMGVPVTAVDTSRFGHIEVIGAMAFRVAYAGNPYHLTATTTAPYYDRTAMAAGKVLTPGARFPLASNSEPVPKTLLKLAHEISQTRLPVDSLSALAVSFDVDLINPDYCIDVPNVLAGKVTLESPTAGLDMTYNMTALANWNMSVALGVNVINLEANNGIQSTDDNSVVESNVALAKTEYNIPFNFSATGDANVWIQLTAPTKYFKRTSLNSYNPRFEVFNMLENRYEGILSGQLPDVVNEEVWFFPIHELIANALEEGFVNGWVKGTCRNANSFAVNGISTNGTAVNITDNNAVPIIASYLTISKSGEQSWAKAFSPGAQVSYAGVLVNQ